MHAWERPWKEGLNYSPLADLQDLCTQELKAKAVRAFKLPEMCAFRLFPLSKNRRHIDKVFKKVFRPVIDSPLNYTELEMNLRKPDLKIRIKKKKNNN